MRGLQWRSNFISLGIHVVQSELRHHLFFALRGLALIARRVTAAHIRVHAGVDVLRRTSAVSGRAHRVVRVGFAPNGIHREATALLVGRHHVHAMLKEGLVIAQAQAAIGPAHVPGGKGHHIR